METRKIGDLTISEVGLGCNNFGGILDADATAQVVGAALDAGITFWDTADIYGGTKSEAFIGQALQASGQRDHVVLATKFGIKLNDARLGGGSPDYIRQAVEDSLTRLQTDRIDLYQIHRPDPDVPIADTLGALNELVRAGKVREIGCSNFSADQLQASETASQMGGLARFASVQNHYSMMRRDPENDGVLEECARQNLGFLPYFPLANGLLTGKYRKNQPLPTGTRLNAERHQDQLSDEKLDIVEGLIAFAEARNHTILELAFAWLLAQPTVVSVIAGATKVEQIAANAHAANWKLTPQEKAEVDALLPQAA